MAALAAALLLAVPAFAAFDCKVSVARQAFDLSSLAGTHHFDHALPTPPTTTKIFYDLSLCAPLDIPNPSPDTCPTGTYVCQTTYSSREGLEDRIVSVVPIAGEIGKGELSPTAQAAQAEGQGWILTLAGGSYNDVQQSVRIEMLCDPNAKETVPTFVKSNPYGSGVAELKWITAAACSTTSDDPPPPPPQDPSVPPQTPPARGWGFFSWFFTLAFIGIVVYFVGGAYYNYTQYGSTGWDMLPHRDVWRDLPYVVEDLFRGRGGGGGSRSGYSALG